MFTWWEKNEEIQRSVYYTAIGLTSNTLDDNHKRLWITFRAEYDYSNRVWLLLVENNDNPKKIWLAKRER